jgi:hypothetical protein
MYPWSHLIGKVTLSFSFSYRMLPIVFLNLISFFKPFVNPKPPIYPNFLPWHFLPPIQTP